MSIEERSGPEEPDDSKSMPSIGAGVKEIRIWDEAGTFRVI